MTGLDVFDDGAEDQRMAQGHHAGTGMGGSTQSLWGCVPRCMRCVIASLRGGRPVWRAITHAHSRLVLRGMDPDGETGEGAA